ncbi:MAG TPA: deoxyribodipyrimidine photo-lyase, partial [Nevskiaceae bacterium]|nr:deoxyribodipyrimidine photo-lyase [Nevskiaceae bacterium]
MSTALVWFRRDLRLSDNPALAAACERHARVVPVYIHAPDEDAPWTPGAATRWWLQHSLAALDRSLRGQLVIRRGPSLPALRTLARECGAQAIYWNRLYEPVSVARDTRIKTALRAENLDVESFNGALWLEPQQLKNGSGEPYRVFTPFWKALQQRLPPRALLPEPRTLKTPATLPGSLRLEALELLPRIRWDAQFFAHWTPGEDGAHARLNRFCEEILDGYSGTRDLPSRDGTSRLSPHLHFGEIS